MLIVHRNLPLMGLFQHVLSLLHVLRFFVRAMVLYQLGAPRLHCEPALHEWAAGREDEHSPRSVPGQRVAARLQARDVPHGCAQRLPRCAHVVHLVAGMSSAVSRVAVPVPAPPFLRIPAPHGLMHVRNRGRRRAQRKRGAQADAAGRRRSHADAGPIGASPVFPLASGCQKMQNRAIYPVDLPQCRKRIFGSTTNRRAFLAFAAALRYPTRATPARAHTALWPPASAGHRRKHGQCLPRLLLRAALGAHETLTPLRRPRVLRSAATPLRRAVPASSLTWCVPVLGCPRPLHCGPRRARTDRPWRAADREAPRLPARFARWRLRTELLAGAPASPPLFQAGGERDCSRPSLLPLPLLSPRGGLTLILRLLSSSNGQSTQVAT